MSEFNKTYMIERFFKARHGEIVMFKFCPAIIRSCKTSYETVRDVITGYMPDTPIIFNEAPIFYRPEEMSFHEWLIDISLNKNIVPDFEKHICLVEKEDLPYDIMMVKDCHTNEILYVHPNFKDWPTRVNKMLDT